jgi:hypothetical protein
MADFAVQKPVRALAESSLGKTAVAFGTTIYSLSPASVALIARGANLLKAQLPSEQQAQVEELLVQFKSLDSSIDLMDTTLDSSISLYTEKKAQTTSMIEEKTSQATTIITEKKDQATTLITETTAQATTMISDKTAQATVAITHHLEPIAERLEPILDSLLTPDENEVEPVTSPSPTARLTTKVSKRMHKRWQKIADSVTDLKSRTVQLAHLDLIAYDQLPMGIGEVSKQSVAFLGEAVSNSVAVSKQSAALVGGAVSTSVAVSKKSVALVGGVLQGQEVSVEQAWTEIFGTFPPRTQEFLSSTQSSAGDLISSTRATFNSRITQAKIVATSAASSANNLFEQHILPALPSPLKVIWADLLQWRATNPQLGNKKTKKLAEAQSESGHELKQLADGSTPVEEFRPSSKAKTSIVLEDAMDEVLANEILVQDGSSDDSLLTPDENEAEPELTPAENSVEPEKVEKKAPKKRASKKKAASKK